MKKIPKIALILIIAAVVLVSSGEITKWIIRRQTLSDFHNYLTSQSSKNKVNFNNELLKFTQKMSDNKPLFSLSDVEAARRVIDGISAPSYEEACAAAYGRMGECADGLSLCRSGDDQCFSSWLDEFDQAYNEWNGWGCFGSKGYQIRVST